LREDSRLFCNEEFILSIFGNLDSSLKNFFYCLLKFLSKNCPLRRDN
jgi:hypothetical protein